MTPAHQKSMFVNVAMVLLLIIYVYQTITLRMEVFGVGTIHRNTNTSSCYQFGKDLPFIQGCESIQVDPRTGLAYMACGHRGARTRWLHPDDKYNTLYEQFNDHIVVMDEKNVAKSLRLLERASNNRLIPFTQDLRVHGFDIFHGQPGELTFMLVNHQRSGSGISIFKHTLGTDYLVHIHTHKSPLLHSPNDVVALSPSAFYATNDVHSKWKWLRKIETLLGLPWGRVVVYSSQGGFKTALEGIPYPNGIAKGASGLVYIAMSSEPSVGAYRIQKDGKLRLLSKKVFRGFVPDNISVDARSGQLLVAGFLNTFEMFRYNREVLGGTNAHPAASIRRLMHFADIHKGFYEERVLEHDGALLPSTTMAVVQRRLGVNRLLLGSVMADHIAICN